MNKKNLFLITFLFILTYILPLFFYHIPFQGTPVAHYALEIYEQPLTRYGEIARVPLSALFFQAAIRLFFKVTPSLSLNLYFAVFYIIHFLCAILLLVVIKKLLSQFKIVEQHHIWWVSTASSLLFMISPIFVDGIAESIAVTRNVGLIAALFYLFFKINWVSASTAKRTPFVIAMLCLITSIFFYESYYIYWLFGLGIMLFHLNRHNIYYQIGETILLSFVLVGAKLIPFFFSINFSQYIMVERDFMHIIKHLIEYGIAITIPNIHGKILWGSLIMVFLWIFFCLVLFLKRYRMKKYLLGLLGVTGAGLIIFSLQQSFIPRALYGLTPLLTHFFVMVIFWGVQSFKMRNIIIGIMVFSSVISFWHFYSLQEEMYLVLKKISEYYEKEPYSENAYIELKNCSYAQTGVRLLDKTNLEAYFTLRTQKPFPIKVTERQSSVDLTSGLIVVLKDRLKHNFISAPIQVAFRRL